MASPGNGLLAPPAVTHLRAQAGLMERSLSADIRNERDDLREAAEQTLNVIMDLSLDGTVRWVSPSWRDVIGTEPDAVKGVPIRSLLPVHTANTFEDVVESMKKDDSRSQIIRFSMKLGPASKLLPNAALVQADTDESLMDGIDAEPATIELEGQGIMVYDRSSGGESHTMWMIRPWTAPVEIQIDLPSVIVEGLGSGAEVLASHLNVLADAGVDTSALHVPPIPVLCRICERQIPPWWFEKHSELCLQEHRAELDVQMAQEHLSELRHAIVKVLDALDARKSRPGTAEGDSARPIAEYKGVPIGPVPGSPASTSSGSSSPGQNRTRDSSSSSAQGHGRIKSFAVRRPLARIVELLLDLCDTALEISTPTLKESPSGDTEELRTQSPLSESRLAQVMQWQSPSNNTLEQEQGLALLCTDSEEAARAKVEAVLRHQRILEYTERIRIEFAVLVADCIEEAMRKAAQIAAGQLSSSDDEQELPVDEPFFAGSFEAPTTVNSLAQALRETQIAERKARPVSSTAVSTRSNSPKECPTPRSHVGISSLLGHNRDTRRNSLFLESEPNDSDGSIRSSSIISRPARIESPVSEFGDLRRHASSRQRHRRSIVLPGTSSPQRQESPSRQPVYPTQPASPLRIAKPRALPVAIEGVKSPITSPLLPQDIFHSPTLVPFHKHHRRQSSVANPFATNNDASRAPSSPRMHSVSAPTTQAKAVAPSIKDFEIIKPISKGAFGSVYLSKKKSTGDYFAIKVLKKADMVAKNQVTNVKAERAIMMFQGESDFVAKLYWTFSSKDYLYLVMEYLNGGDCASLIKILGGLPEDWAKKYLGEVIMGVEHLHSVGIVHRDLKPDNLLIDQKGHLKLTDFGLSRMGLIGRQKRVLNSDGTEIAPDLLKQGPFVQGRSASISIASSRSTSFDFHGGHSPLATPLMQPVTEGTNIIAQPSYFNLQREQSVAHDGRRSTGQRSDSGGSDALNTMFGHFSLQDGNMNAGKKVSVEEASENEGNASPDYLTLGPTISHTSSTEQKNTPPQKSMMPPAMALFDPDDSHRRFVGTPDYLAPETVNGLGQDETSDWWSVGCILFEFLFGYPPFHAETPDKVFENILERHILWPSDEEDSPEVSDDARDLINKFLCLQPHDRIGGNKDMRYQSGGAEIRDHSWFGDVSWESLLEDEAQFVPAPENPEDTEYFDARGATLRTFSEETEDASSPAATPNAHDYHDRPHDALSRVRNQVNSIKRGLMPLHIPPHVRDMKSRRLSEPVIADDFGNFAFKNLPVLEKANKDVIQKLRAEAMAAQSKSAGALPPPAQSQFGAGALSPVPPSDGGLVMPLPIQRMQNPKANRPSSPAGYAHASSSPGRASQPGSPLLVNFVAGQADGRRKVSSNSSGLSQQSSGTGQSGFFELSRGPPSLSKSLSVTAASSPVKGRPAPTPLSFASPQKMVPNQKASTPTSRARSATVGSQDGSHGSQGSPLPADVFSHRKRRSQVFDMSPSSSDNEGGDKASALLRVQRRRQSSRRMSAITLADGPIFRPLDVLICEDHPVSRMVMEKLLEKLRCRTISVSNGPEAVRFAMSDIKFDIIMMEFKLPQINGADVARMIRDTKNVNSTTPIIAITGYLKELPPNHYFDSLIEKPPTASNLTTIMCQFCNWRAPSPGQTMIPLSHPIPSGLRQESIRMDGSPTSGSSGSYAHPPGGLFRGSSREDSISSSMWGDTESVSTDDVPIIISRANADEWKDKSAGLGIDTAIVEYRKTPQEGPKRLLPSVPHLVTQVSAPVQMQPNQDVKRQRSLEKIRAKREIMDKHRHECVESGDDEDEELGSRDKSPKDGKAKLGSKLGTEMMRANSRGSIVSSSEFTSEATSTLAETIPEASEISGATLTPPEIWDTPGTSVKVVALDPDRTPKPQSLVEAPFLEEVAEEEEEEEDENISATPRPKKTQVSGDVSSYVPPMRV